MENRRIVLTGGGTAGHVTPHLALLPELKRAGFEIFYIGSKVGIERGLAEEAGLTYYGISSGKLRRYLSAKNISDTFRIAKGLGDALSLMRKIKPGLVFSKGGFVTVPVVIAARMCGVRVVIHESDITPGLANRLSLPFAEKVCVNFPETLARVPAKKGVLTGSPIRGGLLSGSSAEGLRLCGFKRNGKPVVLFMGGSSGAAAINARVAESLPHLTQRYRVIHICGKGNMPDGAASPGARGNDDYAVMEYAGAELPHLYALTDVVVSRAGANTIFELLALRKPNILIPLTKGASRGDQILNAQSFSRQGFSTVLHEENLTGETLTEAIERLYAQRTEFAARMESAQRLDGVTNVIEQIRSVL